MQLVLLKGWFLLRRIGNACYFSRNLEKTAVRNRVSSYFVCYCLNCMNQMHDSRLNTPNYLYSNEPCRMLEIRLNL